MSPTCPQFYYCTFTPQHRYVVYQHLGPWWQGSAGWVVAIVAVLVLGAVVAFLASLISEARKDRHEREDLQHERDHKLAIEEQRTMQADMAKGNPEMLKLLRER